MPLAEIVTDRGSMTWHILKKDWLLLWPLVALVTAIQIGMEWLIFKVGFFPENPLPNELVRILNIAWVAGVLGLAVAVVHEDSIPGSKLDWLARPLARTDLLLGKSLFVLLAVCVPMLVVNLAHELVLGFTMAPSLENALYKELYVYLCLLVPVMALASMTRNMLEFLVLASALAVLFVVTVALQELLFGADRCPTCETALSWVQHTLEHAGILAGSIVILAIQYFRRRTELARLVAALGVLAFVLVQVPWNVAFALQSRLARSPDGSAPVAIEIDAGDTSGSAEVRDGPGQPPLARQAAEALLQGKISAAIGELKRATVPDNAPVVVRLPLHVSGTLPGQFLQADRAEFSFVDAHGNLLYRATNSAREPVPLIPVGGNAASGSIYQLVEVPPAIYEVARRHEVRLSVDYSLTLMTIVAEHQIETPDGEVREPDVGLCRSKAYANGIRVRCQKIGTAPVCYAATLYGPGGAQNSEVLECATDYRPYIPSATSILTSSGIELPFRDQTGSAQYSFDPSRLRGSHAVLKSYRAQRHFRLSVKAVPLRFSE
jgi:hypothetical protein